MKHSLLPVLAFLALPLAGLAQSAVPLQISYQGRVTDAAGVPLGTPTPVNRTVTFRIWDHATAGAAGNRLYSEQQTVTISNGEFSVLVGTGTAVGGETNTLTLDAVFSGAVRFLGVTVDDGTAAVDPEVSPRQQIVTAAYAFRSKVAESVLGAAITTAMIANNAVTSVQIADSTIGSTKIADASIVAADLADGSVTGAKILDGTIATADLAAGSVTAAKLGSDVGLWTTGGGNVYRATGNVGAGTTTPTAPLSAGAALGNTKIAVWDNGTGTGFMGFGVQSGQFRLHTNASGDRFSFLNAPNGTEVHTILGNGNVGIGATNPGYPLSFGNSVVSTKIALFENGSDVYGLGMGPSQMRLHLGGSGARFSFYNAPAGGEIVTFQCNGNVGIGHNGPQWALHVHRPDNSRAAFTTDTSGGSTLDGLHVGSHVSAAFLWNYEATQMQFGTNNTERLNIAADGRIGINTAPTFGITLKIRHHTVPLGGGHILQMMDSGGGEAFAFANDGEAYKKSGNGGFYGTSDRRVKKDIAPLAGALEQLLKLRSVTFRYQDEQRYTPGVQTGFIAQEVEAGFPSWVKTDPAGLKALGPKGFESLAVQALRELRAEKDAQIAALEARVKELEARNLTAVQRLDALEQRFNAFAKPLVTNTTSR